MGNREQQRHQRGNEPLGTLALIYNNEPAVPLPPSFLPPPGETHLLQVTRDTNHTVKARVGRTERGSPETVPMVTEMFSKLSCLDELQSKTERF